MTILTIITIVTTFLHFFSKKRHKKNQYSFIGVKLISNQSWNDQKYKTITDLFYKTMDTKKHKITQLYVIESETCGTQAFDSLIPSKKKKAFKTDNVERKLFHGTKASVIQTIISNGFNRDFNKVAYFGKGVYFASEASISKDYCDADDHGHSFMFVCRVIVGDYCLGNVNMLQPPTKPDGKSQYDCLVNNIHAPTIFVITRDYHAVPEYLIVFRNKP